MLQKQRTQFWKTEYYTLKTLNQKHRQQKCKI